MGLILITHDLRVAFSMCDRIYVLYAGSVLEVAPAQALEQRAAATPTRWACCSRSRRAIAGSPRSWPFPARSPHPDEVADVCAFSPRCDWAEPQCRAGKPPLRSLARPAGSPPASAPTSSREQMRETRATANRSEHVALPSKGRRGARLGRGPDEGLRVGPRRAGALGDRARGRVDGARRGRERRARRRVGLGQDDARRAA